MIRTIDAMLNIIDDIPMPATIVGASPRNIYERKIELSKSKTAIIYNIIDNFTSSDSLCIS